MNSNLGETKAGQGKHSDPQFSAVDPSIEGAAVALPMGAPPLGHCGDFGLRIARDGTWFHDGSPIGRLPLVKLFASVLRREGDEYWLVTPVERGRILVDDAPFTAVEMTVAGEGTARSLRFRTNLDEIAVAGPDHPIRVASDPVSGAPRPYVLVRGGMEALIVRSVYYQLVELGQEEKIDGEARYGVWSGGVFFALA
jgi:hypothetical protein